MLKDPKTMPTQPTYKSFSDMYLEATHVFTWASKRHFELWFTGQAPKRHRRTERVLRYLTEKGKLRAVRYGRQLIYSLPRRGTFSLVRHGLSVTECLVMFYRSKTDGMVIAEKHFRGLGTVPDGGVLYPNGTLLLVEFCTKDNFLFTGMVKSKISAYKRNIPKIEEKFHAKAVVVFISDVKRDQVERLAKSQDSEYYFTDYETFLKAPIGRALYEPIYLWNDGKTYPLSHV